MFSTGDVRDEEDVLYALFVSKAVLDRSSPSSSEDSKQISK